MKYFLSILLFYCCSAGAFKVPELTGPVMDQAGILSKNEIEEISRKIRSIKEKGIAQIQVLVIEELNNEAIESVSIQITDKWKLGDAKKDNGILFLIAVKEKRMRFEIGQGLEGDIPDIVSQRILVSVVQPYFKKGQFGWGISSGIEEIVRRLTGQESSEQYSADSADDPQPRQKRGNWLFLIYIIIFLIIAMMRRPPGGRGFGRRGHGVWTGGGGFGGGWGGGGGGWSGGGGGFSGGGSSSGW